MSIDLEYAIKTDIRNNPVVRETDVRERREFRRIVLLASLSVGLALFSAFQHFETLRYGYSIEQLRQDRAVRGNRQPAASPEHRDAARATETGGARAVSSVLLRRPPRTRSSWNAPSCRLQRPASWPAHAETPPHERRSSSRKPSVRNGSVSSCRTTDDRPDIAFERSWRQSLKQRVLVVLAFLVLWVVAHPGAAGSAPGVPARRAGGESQAASGAARAARGDCAATSSIVTAKCLPTRWKRGRSSRTRASSSPPT